MDDAQAIGLTQIVSDGGLKVPEDVSLISFNNTEAGRFHHPPLTSFDVNPYQLGAAAMNMILALVKEKPAPASREVPFTLIERESVRVLKD